MAVARRGSANEALADEGRPFGVPIEMKGGFQIGDKVVKRVAA
jgi:hypothetical protein